MFFRSRFRITNCRDYDLFASPGPVRPPADWQGNISKDTPDGNFPAVRPLAHPIASGGLRTDGSGWVTSPTPSEDRFQLARYRAEPLALRQALWKWICNGSCGCELPNMAPIDAAKRKLPIKKIAPSHFHQQQSVDTNRRRRRRRTTTKRVSCLTCSICTTQRRFNAP